MIVDAHHHFWNLEREPLPWMTAEHDRHPAHVRAGRPGAAARAGGRVANGARAGRVLRLRHRLHVRARRAARVDRRRDRLGRPALARCERASVSTSLPEQPKLRGIRHLIHDEPDPHWILQDDVLESLALLEQRRLILELPCVYPRHLGDVPELAHALPRPDDRDRPSRQAAARQRRNAAVGRRAACRRRPRQRGGQDLGAEHRARGERLGCRRPQRGRRRRPRRVRARAG